MALIDFTHADKPDPGLPQFTEFFVKTRSDTSQSDQQHRYRFHDFPPTFLSVIPPSRSLTHRKLFSFFQIFYF